MKQPLRFCKMEGAGNDFIVLDARDASIGRLDALARTLCERRFGVGADGLLAIVGASDDRIEVQYFNSDGSRAKFCGNGARCVAKFAYVERITGAELDIAFPQLTTPASIDGESVSLQLARPTIRLEFELETASAGTLAGVLVDAGVDHVVFRFASDSERPALRDLQRDIARRDASIGSRLAASANVTISTPRDANVLDVRTLELGSGETLACGSAALAAAAIEARHTAAVEFTVIPPAGRYLGVRFAPDGAFAFLDGDATIVFRGEIDSREVARIADRSMSAR